MQQEKKALVHREEGYYVFIYFNNIQSENATIHSTFKVCFFVLFLRGPEFKQHTRQVERSLLLYRINDLY